MSLLSSSAGSVVAAAVTRWVVGLARVGHHRVVTAAVSPVGNPLHTAVRKVDPVAAVHASVAVAFLALAEVGVAGGHPVVVGIWGRPL